MSDWASPAETSPLEAYLAGSTSPFSTSFIGGVSIVLNDTDDRLISLRFAQLLNTCYLAGVAPFAVTGNLTASQTLNTRSAQGTITTSQSVLRCDTLWLVILLLTTSILLCTGIASVVLEALRVGPDVLHSFVALLRDNPYAWVPDEAASSMEDQLDRTKRLRHVGVRLGDVQPREDTGYAAVAVPSVAQPVEKLSVKRRYD